MSQLSSFIQQRQQQGKLLSMCHVVYGYPTVAASLDWMQALLAQGVDILEVQFPFSDPVADGPAIVAACHQALQQPLKVAECLQHLGRLKRDFPQSKILLMSYLNPLFRFGLDRLVEQAAKEGIAGLIIPDLPIEQAADYQALCQQQAIDPIWLVTPITPAERLGVIASQAQGLLYCVSRAGVTGQQDGEQLALTQYLQSIRAHTQVPLAVGFGIRNREQVQALAGLADVAIVGSALLEAYNQGGITAGVAMYRQLFAD